MALSIFSRKKPTTPGGASRALSALACAACIMANMLMPDAAIAQTGYDTTGEPASTQNPLLAQYDGGEITLHELEIYTREMPLAQRIPFARGGGDWRIFMAGELAKMTELTSQAKNMGLHMDPGYLRARDYFINEYLDYLVLRGEVQNKMDLSPERQAREYQTNKQDFYLSPTVTLRQIRTRDVDKISSAAKAIADGADFAEIEKATSQVSPRYRGKVIGPFPSLEEKTTIPPADEVIAAAMTMDEGETTGPFSVGPFHYIVKTIKKTPGRQQTQIEVAHEIEARLRQSEADRMIPTLIDRIQRDLQVQVDEELFAAASTQTNDVLATVGTIRITRGEYTDLNGSVRGPTSPIAASMPTKLKGFILPYMLAEWARSHGYQDRAETQRAIYFYDLQHLAGTVELQLGDQVMPLPSDDQLQARFKQDIESFRRPGQPEPRFEDHKQDMLNALIQGRAPELEKRVRAVVLQKINFKALPVPECDEITALEAVAAAGDKLSSGVRLLKITSKMPAGATPYAEIGRAPAWEFTVAKADGTTETFDVKGPAKLLEGQADYASVGAMSPWVNTWRFDTDSLKRHAVDKPFGDFRAKYKNQVAVQTRMEFAYSEDAPTSPTACVMVYQAEPVDGNVNDGFVVKYDAYSGDVVQQLYGKIEQEETAK